jgi:hypothetical protein
MKKILAVCVIVALIGLAVWKFGVTSGSTAPSSAPGSDRGHGQLTVSPSRVVKVPATISQGDIGVFGDLFDIPIPDGNKFTIYMQVDEDGKFSPKWSRRAVLYPGKNGPETCRFGLRLLDPNKLLPPELKTKKRKLTVPILRTTPGTSSSSEMGEWLEHDPELNGYGTSFAMAVVTPTSPFPVSALDLTAMKPDPANPKNGSVGYTVFHVELWAQIEPMTPEESRKPILPSGTTVQEPLDKPVRDWKPPWLGPSTGATQPSVAGSSVP